MNCPHCRHSIPDGSTRCPICQTPLSAYPPPYSGPQPSGYGGYQPPFGPRPKQRDTNAQLWIIVGAVVIAIVVGFATYYLTAGDRNKTGFDKETTTQAEERGAKNDVKDMGLNGPVKKISTRGWEYLYEVEFDADGYVTKTHQEVEGAGGTIHYDHGRATSGMREDYRGGIGDIALTSDELKEMSEGNFEPEDVATVMERDEYGNWTTAMLPSDDHHPAKRTITYY